LTIPAKFGKLGDFFYFYFGSPYLLAGLCWFELGLVEPNQSTMCRALARWLVPLTANTIY